MAEPDSTLEYAKSDKWHDPCQSRLRATLPAYGWRPGLRGTGAQSRSFLPFRKLLKCSSRSGLLKQTRLCVWWHQISRNFLRWCRPSEESPPVDVSAIIWMQWMVQMLVVVPRRRQETRHWSLQQLFGAEQAGGQTFEKSFAPGNGCMFLFFWLLVLLEEACARLMQQLQVPQEQIYSPASRIDTPQ